MYRKFALISAVLLLLAMGCESQNETTTGQQATTGATQAAEDTAGMATTMEQTAAEAPPGEVVVGGFSVETPEGEEVNVPQVSVEQEQVQQYREQVQPIVEDTVRDVSGLVQPEVRLEDGNLSLDVKVASLEEARTSVEDGLDRLRELQPPEELEPINERLIEAYEQALPAYDDIIEAAGSRDPDRISSAVRENLPRIERFNDETQAILQDLERAAEER